MQWHSLPKKMSNARDQMIQELNDKILKIHSIYTDLAADLALKMASWEE